jgi:UPF0755 protein
MASIIGKKNRRIILAVGVLVLGLTTLFSLRFAFFLTTPAGSGRNVQMLDFEQGTSLTRIAAELEGKGIIGSSRLFRIYARMRGSGARVKAGTYLFNDAMTAPEILHKLVSGDVYVHRFAVPEGYSIYQVGELLDGRKLFSRQEFLRQCADRPLLKELGIDGPSVEGYLYPSTYDINPKMTVTDVIRLMVGQFSKVYDQKFAARAKASGMDRREILTLASMVEKEAVDAAERPLIASVFHNRLKKGMPLQSDPTAVYGVRAFSGKVSRADILRPSPYNTYQIRGLPPGPIGNPGSSAIEAVLNPATTRYLYFVARKDGTHQFSVTLDEHNRAVQQYLRSSADSREDSHRTVSRNDNARTSAAGRR